MDKLKWKERSWVETSLLIVSVGCIIASFLGILFLGDKAAILNLLLIVAEIVYIIIAVTVKIVSFRDEDQYEKIRKVFDEELRKRDDRLYQRQRGIRSMVSRYKCLKSDYSRLESRCAQLEAESRELFELRNECAKLRGENMAMRKHLHIGD